MTDSPDPAWSYAQLVEAADLLREEAADVRLQLEQLAAQLEVLLPEQVEVRREPGLQRRLRSLTVQIGSQCFECRVLPGGQIEAQHARRLRGIMTRPHAVPLPIWVDRLRD